MAKHKLGPGNALIDGLVTLGKALEYAVATEFAVSHDVANPPAVDVAWLKEENHQFPLMIFEVESRASSSAANNALKVFGQDNIRFEKPLFFFHVILSGGRSSRMATLQRQYGTHNYRIYELNARGQSTQLIIDVLNQHRRLQQDIDIVALMSALDAGPWHDLDRNAVLLALEDASFRAPYAAKYAQLTIADERYKSHLIRRLEQDPHESGYGTYLGECWSTPLHLGLLAHTKPSRGPESLSALVEWQERSSFMKQIGPYFGLSQDYDLFLLGLAPTVWALTAALMRDVPGACSYIAGESQLVLDALSRSDLCYSVLTALWTLHIAAAGEALEPFEAARNHLNSRGGINSHFLMHPPTYMDDEPPECSWTEDMQDQAITVQGLEEFRKMLRMRHFPPADPAHLALVALVDESNLDLLGPELRASLHGSQTDTFAEWERFDDPLGT